MNAVAPERTSSNKKIVIIAICLVAACVVALVVTVFRLTQPITTAGNSFLEALKRGDSADACAMAMPPLQSKLRCPDGAQAALGNSVATSWSFTNRLIKNDTGMLAGSGKFIDGTSGQLRVDLVQVDGAWKVAGYVMSR